MNIADDIKAIRQNAHDSIERSAQDADKYATAAKAEAFNTCTQHLATRAREVADSAFQWLEFCGDDTAVASARYDCAEAEACLNEIRKRKNGAN